MVAKPVKWRRLFLLVALLPIFGCSFTRLLASPQAQAPTSIAVDVNDIRTQSAKTVVAYLTLDALMNPSATITPTRTRRPPTSTPTETPTATSTPYKSATPTRTSTKPPIPRATSTIYISNSARLYSQNPKDFTVLSPGQDFDITWVVKNTSGHGWTKKYAYKYSEGYKGYRHEIYYLPEPVKNLQETKLIVDMIAPKEPGQYITRWVLVNERDVEFATFYFTFFVSAK